jgi:Protein of unknown function (DUF3106)
MGRRFAQFGAVIALLTGFLAQTVSAQDGERLREWRARQEARREAAAHRRANGQGGQPNERAMEGLPPKWVERVRDMPPEQQQQFLENNAQFKQLPPGRQQQILQNLDKWNHLTPEQKQEASDREHLLEQLTPEQREYVRGTLLPKWQALPQPRRQAINQHLAMLRNMSPGTQQAALNDPKFVQGLSPDEQSMLRDLNSLRNPLPTAPQAPPQ